MMKYIIISTILIFYSAGQLSAQTAADEYMEARRLFNAGNYSAAQSAFASLTENSQYGAYASYYYALTAYEKGQVSQSISMWKQILEKYPRWDQIEEVLYWLVFAAAEQENIVDVIEYTDAIPDRSPLYDSAVQVRRKLLNNASAEKLLEIYEQKKNNRLVATALATSLYRADSSSRPYLLDTLMQRFDLDKASVMDIDLSVEYKDEYNIAVVLPFMYESLDNPTPVIRNTLVLDLFQGIQLAAAELQQRGVNLKLYTFDTKKSEAQTRRYIEEMKGMDLIIGPFYPGPIDVVSNFSRKEKINMINPLTENVEYMKGNPFAFLFRPSFETTAQKGAEWIVRNQPKKNILLLFDREERDSLFAHQAKLILEADSFNILRYHSVTEESSKLLLDSLVEKYEEYYTKEEADSIADLDGRYIKTRRLRKEEEKEGFEEYPYFYEEEDKRKGRKLIAYEDKLTVPKDSIHTIFAVTKSNPIANNLISIVASRRDSIMLVGFGDWLEFSSINYEQMENLGARFLSPGYMDKNSLIYTEKSEVFKEKFKALPSEFHLVGYELLMMIGNSMDNYGKYWQKELYEKGFVRGILSEGMDYSNSNDNQVVPIVQVENLTLKTINKSQYADKK